MDALEALKTRRSVRAYQPHPVPRQILADLVDCARLAASAINIQPWEFVVVTADETRQAIAALTDHGKFIARAPACIAVLSRPLKYYLEDGSAATQNILLAAHAHGLGACWIAGDKKPYAGDIRRLLGAPEGFKLVSLVAVGYPGERPAKEKRALEDVLHWDTY
jgi:nitroreductase